MAKYGTQIQAWTGTTNAAGQIMLPAIDLGNATNFLILELRYAADDGTMRYFDPTSAASRAALGTSSLFMRLSAQRHLAIGNTTVALDDTVLLETGTSYSLGALMGGPAVAGVRAVEMMVLAVS